MTGQTMGKISDALEKRKQEKVIHTERLPLGPVDNRNQEQAPEFTDPLVQERYSHKLVVLSAPHSVDAENFKVLRAQVLFPKNGKRPRTIMVTSAFPGEGKTFVAANLAVNIAQGIHEHVLLVDCDFRRPHLHQMFGYTNSQGLSEYLTGRKNLADLLIKTEIEKLTFLAAGKLPQNPSELLSAPKMKQFLEEVKNRYTDRYVIVDATPSQVTAEANVLANFVDGIIFVVMAGKSPREVVKRSVANLGKEKVIGFIFNGYSQTHKSYYKYYKKYYHEK
jgi:protein-tyrosine kinase